MRCILICLFVLTSLCSASLQGEDAVDTETLLKPKDRVAILGGTIVERLQSSGALEVELQSRRPSWQLKIRNLGWSGDDVHGIARKVFDQPENGFQRLLRDVNTADPTVVLVAYGFAEASDGVEAVQRFEPGLRRLLDELSKSGRRVILLAPIAMPGYRVDGYDQWISECRRIVNKVGQDKSAPVLDIQWVPDATELTEDRLHPNADGYATLARSMADLLVGTAKEKQSQAKPSQTLRELIVKKNQLFFHRYRPQNETYLFLFRKHEQGNNAVEIPQFDPLIDAADREIWQAAVQPID